jgi:ubiquinone/menaquinone biosynthesis C-methylase UbiE
LPYALFPPKLDVEVVMATQTWDPLAYERNGAFVHELAGGVLEWLAPQPGEYVLDLGCGDGNLTRRIAESGAHVLGVDASLEMVAAARERGVEAEHSRAEELPFRDATFDAVFSNAVLHWVRDQDAMIQQVRRVLKPGGRFVAEMGGHGNVAAIHVALTAVLDRHGFGDREKGVNYYPSADSYTTRLRSHGFSVEQVKLIPRPTKLAEAGMEGWLRTFRRGVLEDLPEDVREAVVRETVNLLEPALRDEAGNWIADYVRLRFVATK